MTSSGSITHLIPGLFSGDHESQCKILDRFWSWLTSQARLRLAGMPQGLGDEEDVALSAFDVFCRAVQKTDGPQIEDRDQLWSILAITTTRKAKDHLKRERRQRRGGGSHRVGDDEMLDGLSDTALDPEFSAMMADQCRLLLDALDDPELEAVALWKLDGFTHEEIAEKIGGTRWTVHRMLKVIRGIWEQHA